MPEFALKKPCRLKRGDTIGIVAPAWSFDPHNFKKGAGKLRQLGYRVKYERTIFSKYWSMAGHDEERAAQINRMFADREIRAIFCAKAGYGSIRTIPYLNKNIIRRNPKIFMGYSDITILLSYLKRIAGMVVFHGPVVSAEIHEAMSPITLFYMLKALSEVRPLGEMQFPTMRRLRRGKASGILVGGNMSLVMSAIGTPYEVDTDNKILFLEDISEGLEMIDNYLMHLKLAGKFKRIKGIIFGRMIDCTDCAGQRYNIQDMLNDILWDVKVPIIYGFPSGHRDAGDANVTLPLGVRVTLDADRLSLAIDESGVR